MFKEFSERTRVRLNYDYWELVLDQTVINTGPSHRYATRYRARSTGTRISGSNTKPSWAEGNRILFEILTDYQIAEVGDYRLGLEEIFDQVNYASLSKNEQLAYWINLYNVTVYEQVALVYPRKNMRSTMQGTRRRPGVWSAKLLTVMGVNMSLDDIVNEILIPNWQDPLVIYGLFQGSIGGPSINTSAYTGSNVQTLLERNALEFVNSIRGVHRKNKTLLVSEFYERVAAVFPNFDVDLESHLREFADTKTLEIMDATTKIKADYYDWRIASLIGMEGGHSIENSLAVLRATYDLGARYMTITHSKSTDWADSATDDTDHGGLTEFGREVVREMNRIGMIVDLSHVAPSTMHDALDIVQAPVMFSHSSAFAVCAHPRNVPDDVLLRVKNNNGVVMITFVGAFVSEEARLARERGQEERNRLANELGDDEEAILLAMEAWRKDNPAPKATLAQVADHIGHVRNIAGIDHVGIGGDFDGTSSIPVGLEDVSKYPDLIVELLRRGYSDEDVQKILGLNILRVMRDVERVAATLGPSTPASDARIEELDTPASDGT